MKNRTPLLVLAALSLLALLPSCGQSAPEGAILRLQFRDVRIAAIDSLRVSFTPQAGQRFMMRPVANVEGITIEVDPGDGALILNVPSAYIRTHAIETDASGLMPQLDIEVWSDDSTTNAEPQVRVTAVQGTDLIAQGAAYTMGWPLELGAISSVNVMCNAGALMQCQRM